MNRQPKAVIYARYSSDDQQRTSNSNVDQGSAESLSDSTVASIPAFKNILAHIKRDLGRITGLVIDDTSRIGRRHIDDLIVELSKKR